MPSRKRALSSTSKSRIDIGPILRSECRALSFAFRIVRNRIRDLAPISFRNHSVNEWWHLTNCLTSPVVVNWTVEEMGFGPHQPVPDWHRHYPLLPPGDGSPCARTTA